MTNHAEVDDPGHAMEQEPNVVSTVLSHESFRDLWGIAVLENGTICVADRGNHCIWSIDPTSDEVSAFAGVPGAPGYHEYSTRLARFNCPIGLAVLGSRLFVADAKNNRIRSINNGIVSTVAGNGIGKEKDGECLTEAQFKYPCGIAVREDESILVSSNFGRTIREINVEEKQVRTFGRASLWWELPASHGVETLQDTGQDYNEADFDPPQLAVGTDGCAYVIEQKIEKKFIKKIIHQKFATTRTDFIEGFHKLSGVATDFDGNVYFCGRSNEICVCREEDNVQRVLCKTKTKDYPHHLFFDKKSGYLYFTTRSSVHKIFLGLLSKPLWDTKLSSALSKLINNKDVMCVAEDFAIFIIEGERLEVAAKSILCIRSEYFNFLLSGERPRPILIKDATYESFHAIITFLITGSLDFDDYCDHVLDIYVLADRFLIPSLCYHSLLFLAKTMSVEDALECLSLAQNYYFGDLKRVCSNLIVENFSGEKALEYLSLAETYELSYLRKTLLDLVVQNYKTVSFHGRLGNLSMEILDELRTRLS